MTTRRTVVIALGAAAVTWPPALARELAAKNPALIVASPLVSVRATRGGAEPGGNMTGVATIGPETGRKRMEILKEALPKISRAGLLMRPPSISPTSARELRLIEESAGPSVKVIAAMAVDGRELDAAFSLLIEQRVQALLLAQVAFFGGERKRILGFASKHGIPVVAHRSEFTDDGALMSYNASLQEQLRRSLHLADRILRGAKPADIPVEQPTKFELVVNLRTAKALGITVPQTILLRADRVIE
jgi:putative ABC transport system substrate-binding protein